MFTNRLILKIALLGLLLALMPTLSSAGTLTSTVNRDKIGLNETLTLTITYDEQVDASSFDLSALNTDFEVLSSSPQSANTVSVINGKTTRQANTTWTVLLAAKKTGTLIIPSLSIGKNRSQAISVEVSDGAQANSSSEPLKVWVSANRDKIVPGQQLIIEVEISAQADVADLNGPQLIIKNADVEPLGQQTFQRIDNGMARQIVILRYAAFASQAGELIIPIMTYTGIQGGRRSFFGSSGSQVVARSAQLTVGVEAMPTDRPASYESAPWFPADAVSIEASWSGDKNGIKAGEPITRTITIRTRGQLANIIPPLNRPAQSNEYKSYKDQPKLDSKVDSDGFISTRIESEAIVASTAGELTLPEFEVKWWDVVKQQWQTATLPAETLNVLAAPGSIASQPQGNSSSQEIDSLNDKTLLSDSSSSSSSDASTAIWQALTALLFLVCVVQTWFLLRLGKARGQLIDRSADNSHFQTEQNAWSKLERALASQEANIIRQRLLTWTRAAFPNKKAVSLLSLVRYANDEELGLEIEKLESRLYKSAQDGESRFDSKPLLGQLKPLRQSILKRASAKPNASALPSLYPE